MVSAQGDARVHYNFTGVHSMEILHIAGSQQEIDVVKFVDMPGIQPDYLSTSASVHCMLESQEDECRGKPARDSRLSHTGGTLGGFCFLSTLQ